ncbi:ParA-like dsDNA partitioning protein [Mycobacterium phage Jeeves]|uniref:ParA-like dsDNA partitioning protein n=1 Tax=Mycobacterium phage Jeeves TaxID=2652402 RepID=A0A5J6T5Q4_9CAUD|nr:ParA-like partition protein [Mycobacterium phage Jeeves]QFG04512.1 ParA-like dsDNA partitioning protein [Mycobacterium phage Jeeves]
MTTISIIHTKGGVGKTTTAMYLATAAARNGVECSVIDADPQRSASEWSDKAAQRGIGLPFEVLCCPERLVLPDSELVLVDTPPGTSDLIRQAITEADLVIIPCGASPIEVERVWPTLKLCHAVPCVVLMTQVDLRAKMVDAVRHTLHGQGVPVLNTLVTQRQSIKKAFGTLPIDLEAYWDVYEELERVFIGV